MGVMTTNFLGKFGEIVFILRNAFIYRGLRKFLGDCYTLSPKKNRQRAYSALINASREQLFMFDTKSFQFLYVLMIYSVHLTIITDNP